MKKSENPYAKKLKVINDFKEKYGINDPAIAISEYHRRKRENRYSNIRLALLIVMAVFTLCFGLHTFLFSTTYYVSTEAYEDVDWEWDDDRDRYEIWLPEIGSLYIKTDKATLVFLPDDYTLNCAVVQYSRNAVGNRERYDLTKFYLNVGWRGYLEDE